MEQPVVARDHAALLPNVIVAPGFGMWLAFNCTHAASSAITRSTSASTRPPVGFSPCRRARITRVSLKTIRSPAATSAGRSVNGRSSSEAPSTCSRRLAVRVAGGACAISSAGSA
jgi:hypothetical protein